MIFNILDKAIRLLLAAAVFGAIAYLWRTVWAESLASLRHSWIGVLQRRNLKLAANYNASIRYIREVSRPASTFTLHVQNLLESTLPVKSLTESSVRWFVYVSVGLGAFAYLLLYFPTGNFFLPLLPAIVLMFLPYSILRARKYQLSIGNSYDIAPIPAQILAKYRMNNRSMYHALQSVLNEMTQTPVSRALDRFLVRLQRKTSDIEARQAMVNFNRQTNTSWAVQLSLIIYKGYVQGIDVEDALKDLVSDITEVQKTLKDQKLDRTDNMLVAIAPSLLLPGGLIFFWMFVSRDMFKYQFHTPEGVSNFAYCAVICLVSLVIAVLFYKPKQDI